MLLVGCQRGLHWRANVDHTMFVLPTTISRFSGNKLILTLTGSPWDEVKISNLVSAERLLTPS